MTSVDESDPPRPSEAEPPKDLLLSQDPNNSAQAAQLTESLHRNPEDPANNAVMEDDYFAESDNALSSVDAEGMHHQREGV